MNGEPLPLKDQIIRILARHLSGKSYRVYLFGSRARDSATSFSDYDIGILAEEPLPLSIVAMIENELDELPVLQKIDLVDLKASSTAFAQSALRESLLIDERQASWHDNAKPPFFDCRDGTVTG